MSGPSTAAAITPGMPGAAASTAPDTELGRLQSGIAELLLKIDQLVASGVAPQDVAWLRSQAMSAAQSVSILRPGDPIPLGLGNTVGAALQMAERIDAQSPHVNESARAVAMLSMIADLSPEAQARIGIINIHDQASVRNFTYSFYTDLPPEQRAYFGNQLAAYFMNEQGDGPQIIAALNALPPDIRQQVVAAEDRTTTQAAAITPEASGVPAPVREEVAIAVTDQGLADQQTAAAIERIDADRRAGRAPNPQDVAILRARNQDHEDRMARRVATMTEPLPTVLQEEIRERGTSRSREIIQEGRAIMRDENRKDAAIAVLRALEENPNLSREELLQRGFTPEQIRDAAYLDAYAIARGVTHVEDIVERGQDLDRGRDRGQGHDRQPTAGYTPPSERLIIKQAEIDVLMDGHLRFADSDGSRTFNRADIDAAIAGLQRSGVVIDHNGNGRLDRDEIGRLESQLQQQAQQQSSGPVRGA